MTHPRLFLLGALIFCAGRLCAAGFTGSDPLLQYEGRHAVLPDGSVRLGFPGVVLRFKAQAPTIVLKCSASSETVFVDLQVDGGEPVRTKLDKGVQELAIVSAKPGTHQIELTRRTESWQGTLDIISVSTDEGSLVQPAPLPERKLLFIGDSITCGASTDIRPGEATSGAQLNSGRLAFGRVLARRLGAQAHLVSYGGRGVIRDWQGIRDTANAPQFYERALPDESSPRWKHADYVPDLVAICLGTNDFNQGCPDENEFENAYVEFVLKVLRDAPRARVILLDSPMVTDSSATGPRKTMLSHYLDVVVKRVASDRVTHVPLAHYAGRSEDAHPVAAEHVGIAAELEPVIRTQLGW